LISYKFDRDQEQRWSHIRQLCASRYSLYQLDKVRGVVLHRVAALGMNAVKTIGLTDASLRVLFYETN
jgi:hypothetical protein